MFEEAEFNVIRYFIRSVNLCVDRGEIAVCYDKILTRKPGRLILQININSKVL